MAASVSDDSIGNSSRTEIDRVAPRRHDHLLDSGLLDELAPEIAVVRDWPSRVAVVVSEDPDPRVVASLSRLGFSAVVTSFEEASDALRRVVPFAFLMLGPGCSRAMRRSRWCGRGIAARRRRD